MTAMDAFFRDCGGVEPLRAELTPRGGGTGVGVEFRKPFVLVGCGPGADLGVDSPATAPRQLYLQLVGGRLFAVQLSGDCPTLGGGGAWRSGWVAAGDPFLIHETEVRFLNPVQGSAPPAPSPVVSGPSPLFTLECENGTDKLRSVTNNRPLLLIGRDAPSKVRVRHPSLSRAHAAVVATPGGRFWLVDLSSGGGVRVKGQAAAVAELDDGDVFHCGLAAFRFTLPKLALSAAATGAPVVHPASPLAVAPAPTDGAALGAVLDQFALLQQQSQDQFRQTLGSVMQMVGGMMAEQRAFVKDELDRMERIILATSVRQHQPPAAAPATPHAPQPALPAAPPTAPTPRDATPARPAVPDAQLHSWVEGKLQSLRREEDTIWKKLRRSVTGEPPG